MREHLFKAKRLANNKWVCGDLLHFQDCTIIHNYVGQIANEIKPRTVCEYTGQTDKEANKIFENDLVIWPVEDYCEGTVFKVEWESDNCRFWATTLDDKYSESFDSFFAEHCKVIGNIHDKEGTT